MDQWFNTHEITSFAGSITTTELYKTEDGYILKALVPGFLKEEVTVDVSKNHISIEAQKLETKAGDSDPKLLSGGFPTSLSYREEIRATLDSATADATLENGVLTVTVKCLAKAPTGTKVTVR
jgi:HSP20 family molecular chaperone IbpA